MFIKLYKLLIIIFTLSIAVGCSKMPQEVTTASGLKYIDIQEGTGTTPVNGSHVIIHYTGTLENGKKFDSSVDRNQPYQFEIGHREMPDGLEEGIMTMKTGGKRKLIIPPHLAYGSEGAGGVIPPNSTIIFEVELIDVK